MKAMTEIKKNIVSITNVTGFFIRSMLIPKGLEEADERQKAIAKRLEKTLSEAGNDALEDFVKSIEVNRGRH